MSAPRYSLRRRKTGTVNAARLTKWDVQEIRRWVRTEGYGLTPKQQVTALCAEWPAAERTMWDVIRNTSWHDPSYDPTVPLFVPPAALASPWLLFFILWWRSVCASSYASSAVGSVRTATTISN